MATYLPTIDINKNYCCGPTYKDSHLVYNSTQPFPGTKSLLIILLLHLNAAFSFDL